MGYQVYWIGNRFCGYGVPCLCEHPDCNEEIDRGLAYCCGNEPGGCENGCGLYFCGKHMFANQKCERCNKHKECFDMKPELPEWVKHLLTDKSWAEWRKKNPEKVKELKLLTPASQDK